MLTTQKKAFLLSNCVCTTTCMFLATTTFMWLWLLLANWMAALKPVVPYLTGLWLEAFYLWFFLLVCLWPKFNKNLLRFFFNTISLLHTNLKCISSCSRNLDSIDWIRSCKIPKAKHRKESCERILQRLSVEKSLLEACYITIRIFWFSKVLFYFWKIFVFYEI